MAVTTHTDQLEYRLCCPSLPLAVYYEVAAHLRQVAGVETELLPQTSSTFDYHQSQIGGLVLRFADAVSTHDRQQVDQILAYYGDRFSPWQAID